MAGEFSSVLADLSTERETGAILRTETGESKQRLISVLSCVYTQIETGIFFIHSSAGGHLEPTPTHPIS